MKIKCQECKKSFQGMQDKEDTCPSCLKTKKLCNAINCDNEKSFGSGLCEKCHECKYPKDEVILGCGEHYRNAKQELSVYFTQAYASGVKAGARIDGKEYVIDLDWLKEKLEKEILEKGYTTSKTSRQKYPRLIINL